MGRQKYGKICISKNSQAKCSGVNQSIFPYILSHVLKSQNGKVSPMQRDIRDFPKKPESGKLQWKEIPTEKTGKPEFFLEEQKKSLNEWEQ